MCGLSFFQRDKPLSVNVSTKLTTLSKGYNSFLTLFLLDVRHFDYCNSNNITDHLKPLSNLVPNRLYGIEFRTPCGQNIYFNITLYQYGKQIRNSYRRKHNFVVVVSDRPEVSSFTNDRINQRIRDFSFLHTPPSHLSEIEKYYTKSISKIFFSDRSYSPTYTYSIHNLYSYIRELLRLKSLTLNSSRDHDKGL